MQNSFRDICLQTPNVRRNLWLGTGFVHRPARAGGRPPHALNGRMETGKTAAARPAPSMTETPPTDDRRVVPFPSTRKAAPRPKEDELAKYTAPPESAEEY